jgi:hypothetical protein
MSGWIMPHLRFVVPLYKHLPFSNDYTAHLTGSRRPFAEPRLRNSQTHETLIVTKD